MKRFFLVIISLIMIFGMVGCLDNTNPLPIIPDSSNLATDTDGNSKEDSSDSSTETEDDESLENGDDSVEDDESLENGDDSVEDDDSSSNENENKPSNETGGWTGFY